MQFEGEERIDAPQQTVWDFITDPRRFSECAQGGMENVRVVDDRHFTFEISLPGQRIKCDGTWLERDAPNLARMEIKGGTFLGRATMTNTVRLSQGAQPSETQVKWQADVQLTGILEKLAGNRIAPLVQSANQDVIRCLQEKLKTS